MRFTEMAGKKMTEIEFEVLRKELSRHLFFKFMESGRAGLESGVNNVVDTLIGFQFDRNPIKGKTFNTMLTDEESRYVRETAIEMFLNNFVTSGTKEFEDTITHLGMMIASCRK